MSGFFSRFAATNSPQAGNAASSSESSKDPYSTFNDIDEGAPYAPAKPSFGSSKRSSSSDLSSGEVEDSFQPVKTVQKSRSSFMVSTAAIYNNQQLPAPQPHLSSSDDEVEVDDVPQRPTFGRTKTSKQQAGKMRKRRTSYSSSTEEESSEDDNEQQKPVGTSMYTRRKRTLADLEATSFRAPQATQSEEYSERLIDMIKEYNFQSNEREVEQLTRSVFGRHDEFFKNLRMFVSAFEGAVQASPNDFWRSGLSHSYKELGKLFVDHFEAPSNELGEDQRGMGYNLLARHFGSSHQPSVRPVTTSQMPIIWQMLEDMLKIAMTADVVDDIAQPTGNGNNVNAEFTIQPEKVALTALNAINQLSFNKLGIQLVFHQNVIADLRNDFTVINAMVHEEQDVNLDNEDEREALANLISFADGKYDPYAPKQVKEEHYAKTLEYISHYNAFFNNYVVDVIQQLKATYDGPNPQDLFQFEVYDEDLRPPPIVNYLMEIRHLSQQEQEARILSAVGLSGNLRVDLMALLERMAKPAYFSAVQQAYFKIENLNVSLYDVINDSRVMGPRFVNLCRAQYNADRADASNYTSAQRSTANKLAVGQAIDEFRSAIRRPTSRQFSIQAPNLGSVWSIAQSNTQLEESIRSAIMQETNAIL